MTDFFLWDSAGPTTDDEDYLLIQSHLLDVLGDRRIHKLGQRPFAATASRIAVADTS